MFRASILPFVALMFVGVMSLLIEWQWINPGEFWFSGLKTLYLEYGFALVFLVILLESIVFMGFYLPGQFIAVLLVVMAEPGGQGILGLTLCMVAAATLGSLINYRLGLTLSGQTERSANPSVWQLMAAMIHINALAMFMFNLGLKKQPVKYVWLAGLLNLPYYLLLIGLTAVLSEEVIQFAESPGLVAVFLSTWLAIALWYDWHRANNANRQDA